MHGGDRRRAVARSKGRLRVQLFGARISTSVRRRQFRAVDFWASGGLSANHHTARGDVTMRSIRHPLSGALYDRQPDGTVRVEKDGRAGLFRADGSYISGDIYFADPQMGGWIGGRELAARSRHSGNAVERS